jgi:DNA polymerase V
MPPHKNNVPVMKKSRCVQVRAAPKHLDSLISINDLEFEHIELSTHTRHGNNSEINVPSFQNISQTVTKCSLPPALLQCSLYNCSVSAGFPSPAEEWDGFTLDLNQHLIHNPPATFFVRARGDSMNTVGIFNSDILIVDRSLTAKHLDIVVASVNGELTVKRLICKNGKTILKAENPSYAFIELNEEMEVTIWGVVTNVIHNLRS